ncbi:hypothetical protein Patl1_06988 [Pistacia atlantica]|uniref:Uncharacterized protein n=1 Tax=Pistacia atlantica TaxID=434234 RepID=A0ACC1ALF3_9ROSI|nr:hypothetical protein Patl1_06988 [Pistacia atlantica]
MILSHAPRRLLGEVSSQSVCLQLMHNILSQGQAYNPRHLLGEVTLQRRVS